jgi:hypothetical protein
VYCACGSLFSPRVTLEIQEQEQEQQQEEIKPLKGSKTAKK